MIYFFFIIGVIITIGYCFNKLINLIILYFDKKNYKDYKYYVQKKLMTNYEKYFYNIFLELEKEYFVRIQPQVNLATIIDINTNGRSNYLELFRNIDFYIFTRDFEHLILLIEINDKTHNNPDRIKRDKKVRKICEEAGIKLITFYSDYPNNKDYVINRIKKELNIK